MDTSRNNILARLKAAQDNRGKIEVNIPDFTSPIYHPINQSLDQEFKNNLELIGGEAIICQNNEEAIAQILRICEEKNQNKIFCKDSALQSLIDGKIEFESDEKDFLNLSIGLTGCEFLVAHLGSVLISSAQVSGRRLNVFPETHVVIAYQTQLTDYLDQAIERIQKKYKNGLPSLISNITGPSRTADIEKTLIMGMHGPKSLIVLIVNEPY